MLVRHVKRGGIYRIDRLTTRESDLAILVCYTDVHTGEDWTRPASEFFDGRYVRYILPKPEPEAQPAPVLQ